MSYAMPNADRLASATQAWREALGPQAVVDATEDLAACGRTSIGRDCPPPLILRPKSRDRLPDLVRIANRFAVPIYPISCGRNWGYGTARPVAAGSVVVDLSGLKAIADYDDRAGLITVEPGVSQRDLAAFLDRAGGGWLTPTSGAGPEASILGNALERGYGLTPEADHFGAVQSMEVVLPDGSVLTPALARAGGTAVDPRFKWGLGPYLDGLFTQSGFGIVTRITVALSPRPRRVAAVIGSYRNDSSFEGLVEATRLTLLESRGLIGGINLMNRRRVVSMFDTPEPELVASGKPIPESRVLAAARQRFVGAWTVMGAAYGNRDQVRASARVFHRCFRTAAPGGLRQVIDRPTLDRFVKLLGWVPGQWASRQREQLTNLRGAIDVLEGKPSTVALPLCYWRRRQGLPPKPSGDQPPDLDPARDGCGLIWYSPLVPIEPAVARRYVENTTRVCLEHDIDPLITLTSLSPRCFDSTVPLLFDASDPATVDRAHRCYEALLDANAAIGCFPYRLPVTHMKRVVDPEEPVWQTVDRIKRALDPQGILSPGRYAPLTASDDPDAHASSQAA